MKKIYPAYFIIILLSSCSSKVYVHYVGAKNPQTEKIEVFVDESAIKKDYTIIGKGYPEISNAWEGKLFKEKIVDAAIAKAKKNGADAILFKEILLLNPGADKYRSPYSDSVRNSLIKRTNTPSSLTTGYFHDEILFLKYK